MRKEDRELFSAIVATLACLALLFVLVVILPTWFAFWVLRQILGLFA